MLKDMDFGVYGKGVDGYVHYSLAMERIREEEENRKALMDEFDNDADEMDERSTCVPSRSAPRWAAARPSCPAGTILATSGPVPAMHC